MNATRKVQRRKMLRKRQRKRKRKKKRRRRRTATLAQTTQCGVTLMVMVAKFMPTT